MERLRSESWPRPLEFRSGQLTDYAQGGRLEGRRALNPGDSFPKRVRRFSNTRVGSEPFAKLHTLLLFSTGYKSVDLIRSAWKRFVLIVQPLQFHYSLDIEFWARSSRRYIPEECFDESRGRCGVHRDFKNPMMASWSSLFSFSNF
jgi:hypothetical protein